MAWKNSSLEFYKAGIESKDESSKTQAKAERSLVASTNSEQDNSDLVGKLDLEGHFTYSSSPLNADLLSELSKNRGFKLTALNITSIPGHIEELRIYVNSDCIDSGAPARAKRAQSGAPWVRKFGKLSTWENLVMT